MATDPEVPKEILRSDVPFVTAACHSRFMVPITRSVNTMLCSWKLFCCCYISSIKNILKNNNSISRCGWKKCIFLQKKKKELQWNHRVQPQKVVKLCAVYIHGQYLGGNIVPAARSSLRNTAGNTNTIAAAAAAASRQLYWLLCGDLQVEGLLVNVQPSMLHLHLCPLCMFSF